MDILGQYEKQFPQENKPAIPQQRPLSEHGFLINLVMRVSGGMIKDEAQATYVTPHTVASLRGAAAGFLPLLRF